MASKCRRKDRYTVFDEDGNPSGNLGTIGIDPDVADEETKEFLEVYLGDLRRGAAFCGGVTRVKQWKEQSLSSDAGQELADDG